MKHRIFPVAALVAGLCLTTPLSAQLGFTPCVDGRAGIFPCANVDLLSFVPRARLGFGPEARLNDIWGWTDPQNGVEYAIVGLTHGTAFVRLADPTRPEVLGVLPSRFFASTWRDMKVFGNHAFISADRSPGHGIQIFDLTRLRGLTGGPVTFQPDADYFGPGLGFGGGMQLGSTHNVAINEETGFLYILGSDTCGGGPHMVDVSTPRRPRFAGCFTEDGDTHDGQCVVYRGPAGAFAGRELCFLSNEDTLTVADVTDKRNPRLVSRTAYPNVGFTHQNWLTQDHRFVLVNDELDEIRFGNRTRTLIFNVTDPASPRFVGAHLGRTRATTHNFFVRGRFVYEANYAAGLQIFELSRVGQGRLREVGFFDTRPGDDEPSFRGAWGNYPFFASGIVAVSSTDEGLFVLRPNLAAAGPVGDPPADRPGPPETGSDPVGILTTPGLRPKPGGPRGF